MPSAAVNGPCTAVMRAMLIVSGRDDEALARAHMPMMPIIAGGVDLGKEGLLLALGRHLLREAEGVPQVERDRVRPVDRLERGEVAGLAALDVVLLAVKAEHVLQTRDEKKAASAIKLQWNKAVCVKSCE